MSASTTPKYTGVSGASPIILTQTGIKRGIPSSGSIGNNGALSGLTAMPVTYSGGIYLYFPANAIVAGSAAGFYWTVMSSTTAGTIYNNTWSSGVPTAPASPTAFATTGPGAYTQSTSEITISSITLPGGMMGANGVLRTIPTYSMANTANNKTFRQKLGGTQTHGYVVPSYATLQMMLIIRNCGVQNLQASVTNLDGIGATTSAIVQSTIDTSSDQTVLQTVQLATATDFVVLEGSTMEVLPA